MRRLRQYSYHFGDSVGLQKNSISICSNSRDRKVKFLGVISLRKLFPTCATPNGMRIRVLSTTFLKLTKIPWAVSGRKKAAPSSPLSAPTYVLNMRLNSRGSVSVPSSVVSGPRTLGRWLGSSLSRVRKDSPKVSCPTSLLRRLKNLSARRVTSSCSNSASANIVTKIFCSPRATHLPRTWSNR